MAGKRQTLRDYLEIWSWQDHSSLDTRDRYLKDFEDTTARAAAKHKVPVQLLRALGHQEARWNYGVNNPKANADAPDSTRRKDGSFRWKNAIRPGGQGPFQFLRSTGRGYGMKSLADLHDPEKSAFGAAEYLRRIYDNEAGGDWDKAIFGYNNGPDNIAGMQPHEFGDTDFVKNVKSHLHLYAPGDVRERRYQAVADSLGATLDSDIGSVNRRDLKRVLANVSPTIASANQNFQGYKIEDYRPGGAAHGRAGVFGGMHGPSSAAGSGPRDPGDLELPSGPVSYRRDRPSNRGSGPPYLPSSGPTAPAPEKAVLGEVLGPEYLEPIGGGEYASAASQTFLEGGGTEYRPPSAMDGVEPYVARPDTSSVPKPQGSSVLAEIDGQVPATVLNPGLSSEGLGGPNLLARIDDKLGGYGAETAAAGIALATAAAGRKAEEDRFQAGKNFVEDVMAPMAGASDNVAKGLRGAIDTAKTRPIKDLSRAAARAGRRSISPAMARANLPATQEAAAAARSMNDIDAVVTKMKGVQDNIQRSRELVIAEGIARVGDKRQRIASAQARFLEGVSRQEMAHAVAAGNAWREAGAGLAQLAAMTMAMA